MAPTISLTAVPETTPTALPTVSGVKIHASTLAGVSYKEITLSDTSSFQNNFAKIKKIALESLGVAIANAGQYEATVNYTTGVVTLKHKDTNKEYGISTNLKDSETKEKIIDLIRQGATILKPAFHKANIETHSGLDSLHLSSVCHFKDYSRLTTQSKDFKDAIARLDPVLSTLPPAKKEKFFEKMLFLHAAKEKAKEHFTIKAAINTEISSRAAEIKDLEQNIKVTKETLENLEKQKREHERKITELSRGLPEAPADGTADTHTAARADITAARTAIEGLNTKINATKTTLEGYETTQKSADHQAKIKAVEERNAASEHVDELNKIDCFTLAVAVLHTDQLGNPEGSYQDIIETLRACKTELKSRRTWGVGMKESMSHLLSLNHGYSDERLKDVAMGIELLRETSKSKRIALAHSHHADARKEQPLAHLLMAVMKTYAQTARSESISDANHARNIKEHAHGLDGRINDETLNVIGKASFNVNLSKVHTPETLFD
jgi:hypothetical protein